MIKVYIACAAADRPFAQKLRALLAAHGIDVLPDATELAAGDSYVDWVEAAIRESTKVLVLWSAASVESEYVRTEAALALASGKLIPVRLGVEVPAEFSRVSAVDLDAWSGEDRDRRIERLLNALERGSEASALRPPTPARFQTKSAGAARGTPVGGRAPGGFLGRAVERFREFLGTRKPERIEPPVSTNIGAHPSSKLEPPGAMEPVWLGASAPRQCVRGQRFTAALAAYVEAARESAREKLSALGEPGDRIVMDVAPQRNAAWRVGAPVTVRLAGEGVDLTPAESSFEWNGRENLAAFAARVRDDAPETISLAFEVFVADVPIAFIPMALTVATRPQPLTAQAAEGSLPDSVFASYASKDAPSVTQRLSTLLRWSPGLDIFQDCLDLQPNKSFRQEIEAQIAQRDVFLLFWSRNAAASQWVQWEYETARTTRGLDAILPMPLEDPAIAPPPADLADRHFRDRFMLAGYGLAGIRDESSRASP